MTTPTVILAGGLAKPDLEAATGQKRRALVVVNGKTLLRHVVEAVLTAGLENTPLGPITVVGAMPASADYACLSDQGDIVSNMFAGLADYRDAPFALISTSDLPFITGPILRDFVIEATRRAEESGASLLFPIVPVASCYAKYPGVKRTSLRLREGTFTGGNVALVRPALLLSLRDQITRAYAARKSPARLAAMLGLGTLGRVLLAQRASPHFLTIPLLENRVSRLLGGTARGVICPDPEIATDLDRPSDFAAVGLALPTPS